MIVKIFKKIYHYNTNNYYKNKKNNILQNQKPKKKLA